MWSKSIDMFNPYEALKKSKNTLEFKISIFKVKRSQWKLMKHYLKILKSCTYHANKIDIPVSTGEIMVMELLLSVYDETITELNKNMDRYREYVSHIKE